MPVLPDRTPLLLCVLLALTLLIYTPGAAGPYLADDIPNLVNNRHLLLDPVSWDSLKDAALSSPASPYYRPLAMLSFSLGYTAAGTMDPGPAKLINILLHLCTGLLACLLARALLPHLKMFGRVPERCDIQGIALLAAGMWLLHPLFVSTVLYTVQRMSVLSAMFVMGGGLFYLQHRPRLANTRDCVILLFGIAVFTVLAFLCKENGALLPGFLLLIEWTAFGFRFRPETGRGWRATLAAVLVLPSLFVLGWLALYYFDHAAQEAPGYYFTIHERFLTQFRALAQYAGWLSLTSFEPMGLYHDDFPLSRELLAPPTTLLSAVFLGTTTAAALLLAARRELAGIGLLWFLWGHVLESSVIPLAPVFEHRNYLPGFGLTLALAGGLWGGMARAKGFLRPVALAGILLALPAYQLHMRVGHWSDERAFIIHSMQSHPDSALTLLSAAVFLDAHRDPDGAKQALRSARAADPREAGLVYAEFALHCEHGAVRPPEAGLSESLLAAAAESPRTVTARKQFVEMVKVCAATTISDTVLADVYARRIADRNADVAMIARYGMGVIHLHRGEYAQAIAEWTRAVEEFPDGDSIRPLLDELRNRTSTDRP